MSTLNRFVYVTLVLLLVAVASVPAADISRDDLERIFSFQPGLVDELMSVEAERAAKQKREQISPLWLQGSQLGSNPSANRQANLQAAAQKVGVNPQLGQFLLQQQKNGGILGPQSFLAQAGAAGRANAGIVGRQGAANRRRFNLQAKLMEAASADSGLDLLDDNTQTATGNYAQQQTHTQQQNQQCGVLRPRITSYVANGVVTDPLEQPWYAQLTIGGLTRNDSSTFCGGTLISRHHILTAAHCHDEISASKRAKSTLITMRGVLIDDDKYFQQAGGVGLPQQRAKKGKSKKVPLQFRATHVYLHQHYVPAMSEMEAKLLNKAPGPKHDLAIIEFEFEDSEITELLMPVCLPGEGAPVKPGTKCKVMGHGFMNADDEDNFVMPSELQSADVVISTNQACRDEVDSMSIKSKISSDTVCIRGPMHPCVGDSGGPLICTDNGDLYKGHKSLNKHNKRAATFDDLDVDDLLELTDEEEDDDFVDDEDEATLNMSYRVKRHYLVGVTSFAVSTDQHDRCGQFRSAVFGKISNYMPWIKSITGHQ